VVAGPVGCGKSSLLQASLGELDVTSGSLESIQNVVYAPQSLQCGNQISRRHRRDGVPVIASARWRGGRPTPSTRLLDGVEAHEGIS